MLNWLRGSKKRERPPRRVVVVDAAAVDRRRSVVLIRRDNIEHLVMIGGPTDVVIEPNIMRATGAREPAWPAAPGPTRLAAELSNRLTPSQVPAPPPRSAAPRVRAPTLAPPIEPLASLHTVHNLEKLRQELEAALSRSATPQGRPPVTHPLAVPLSAPPPLAQSDAPILELEQRSEPRLDAKPEPKSEPKIEPRFEPPKPAAESTLEPKPGPKLEQPPEPQPKGEPAESAGKKASDIL